MVGYELVFQLDISGKKRNIPLEYIYIIIIIIVIIIVIIYIYMYIMYIYILYYVYIYIYYVYIYIMYMHIYGNHCKSIVANPSERIYNWWISIKPGSRCQCTGSYAYNFYVFKISMIIELMEIM